MEGGARGVKKKSGGTLTAAGVAHDTRDQGIDFVRRWSEATQIGAARFSVWLGIAASTFYPWRHR